MKETRQHHPMIGLIDELLRLTSRVRSTFADATEISGLNAMQNTVLTAVVESRRPPTVPQIGRSLGHPRQVIQRAVNVLLDKELIETAPNPDHKRAPLLVSTPAGEALKDDIDARAIEAADELMRVLDSTRCEDLTVELRQLRTDIEQFLRTEGK